MDCASSIVSGSLVPNVSGMNRKSSPDKTAIPKNRKKGSDSEYCAWIEHKKVYQFQEIFHDWIR